MTDTTLVKRVRELVEPIAADLDLDVYDVEQRGGTLRVTLDTRPGTPAGRLTRGSSASAPSDAAAGRPAPAAGRRGGGWRGD